MRSRKSVSTPKIVMTEAGLEGQLADKVRRGIVGVIGQMVEQVVTGDARSNDSVVEQPLIAALYNPPAITLRPIR